LFRGILADRCGAQAGLVDAPAEALDVVGVVLGKLRKGRTAGGGAEAVEDTREHRETQLPLASGALGEQGELRRAVVAAEEVGEADRIVAGETGITKLRRVGIAAALTHR